MSALLFFLGVGVVSASEGDVRLGIEAVDTGNGYFDVTLSPGESADLTIRFANLGEVPTGATVFAADVYTITGGGMGMRDLDGPQTGATNWLSFETQTMDLEPGEGVEQTFTVSVPEDASPGDYITSIVIQSTEPQDIDPEDPQFSEGVPVAIDVPGEREPRLDIASVSHSISDDQSLVEVEIVNTGNTHLRPQGEFTLLSDEGNPLASSPRTLDTIYAGTSTTLEVLFMETIAPGEYGVRLELRDDETGAEARVDGMPLTVADPDATTDDDPDDENGVASVPGATEDATSPDLGWGVWVAGALGVVGILTILAALFLTQSDRLGRAFPSVPTRTAPRMPVRVSPPPTASRRQANPRPLRQLTPRGREADGEGLRRDAHEPQGGAFSS